MKDWANLVNLWEREMSRTILSERQSAEVGCLVVSIFLTSHVLLMRLLSRWLSSGCLSFIMTKTGLGRQETLCEDFTSRSCDVMNSSLSTYRWSFLWTDLKEHSMPFWNILVIHWPACFHLHCVGRHLEDSYFTIQCSTTYPSYIISQVSQSCWAVVNLLLGMGNIENEYLLE